MNIFALNFKSWNFVFNWNIQPCRKIQSLSLLFFSPLVSNSSAEKFKYCNYIKKKMFLFNSRNSTCHFALRANGTVTLSSLSLSISLSLSLSLSVFLSLVLSSLYLSLSLALCFSLWFSPDLTVCWSGDRREEVACLCGGGPGRVACLGVSGWVAPLLEHESATRTQSTHPQPSTHHIRQDWHTERSKGTILPRACPGEGEKKRRRNDCSVCVTLHRIILIVS